MAFRRRAKPPADPLATLVDPVAVPAPYRAAVGDAVRVRAQFQSLVATTPDPLREMLADLGGGVDAGVLAVWRAVQEAMRLESVVGTLDAERVREDLKRAKRAEQAGQVDASTVEVLTERFASTQRLLNALDELRQRIPVLEARLGTAVARAAELALTSSLSPSRSELEGLRGDLTQLVRELEALQSAADEVG